MDFLFKGKVQRIFPGLMPSLPPTSPHVHSQQVISGFNHGLTPCELSPLLVFQREWKRSIGQVVFVLTILCNGGALSAHSSFPSISNMLCEASVLSRWGVGGEQGGKNYFTNLFLGS
jgi:hypothetical protein